MQLDKQIPIAECSLRNVAAEMQALARSTNSIDKKLQLIPSPGSLPLQLRKTIGVCHRSHALSQGPYDVRAPELRPR